MTGYGGVAALGRHEGVFARGKDKANSSMLQAVASTGCTEEDAWL